MVHDHGQIARIPGPCWPAGRRPSGFIGIDAPEVSPNDRAMDQARRLGIPLRELLELGRRSRDFASRLAPPGTRVRLELDVQTTDRYGRLLSYLWLPDGSMVNERILEAGWALLLTVPPTCATWTACAMPRGAPGSAEQGSGPPQVRAKSAGPRGTPATRTCASRLPLQTWTAGTSPTGGSGCCRLTPTGSTGTGTGSGASGDKWLPGAVFVGPRPFEGSGPRECGAGGPAWVKPAAPLPLRDGTSRQKLYAVRERILRRMCLEECRESPYEPVDVVRLHGARVDQDDPHVPPAAGGPLLGDGDEITEVEGYDGSPLPDGGFQLGLVVQPPGPPVLLDRLCIVSEVAQLAGHFRRNHFIQP